MGDLTTIKQHHPAMADFKLNELIGFRGDVLTYRANLRRDSFSTDSFGFRHSVFKGKEMSLLDCLASERYGLVLGPSTTFGTGIAGNGNTMASLLGERFGFPFGNAAMPGGNGRNLNSLLIGCVAMARRPPATVILSNGGDLANFCEAGMVDPLFGSPNHVQLKALGDARQSADAEANFDRLLTFTNLWTNATATLCRAYGTKLVIVRQSTFFDKKTSSKSERDSKLGVPGRPGQDQVFAKFRAYEDRFLALRKQMAERLKIPLAGLGLADRLTFIDEFHLDREGMQVLSQDVGDKLAPLLEPAKGAKALARKKAKPV